MELTAEKMIENWERFLEFITCYVESPRKEKLLEFYKKHEERFMMMPASNKPQYHNCMPGGYIDHVCRVVDIALDTKDMWARYGSIINFTDEELVFSALNHDLGKFGTEENAAYIEQTDQWRKDKLNEVYTYNTKLEYMSVPDRGMWLMMSNGINLSRNEMMAIKLHDGLYDEANKPYLMSFAPESKPRTSLVYILHQADIAASRIEFEREWLPKLNSETVSESKPVKTTKATLKNKSLAAVGAKNNQLDSVINNFFKQ